KTTHGQGRRLQHQAVLRSLGFARGSRFGPGASSSAVSAGTNQQPPGHGSGVPRPPYIGSSLDHRTAQSVSRGGAVSGSAIERREHSAPRLTNSSRSSSG